MSNEKTKKIIALISSIFILIVIADFFVVYRINKEKEAVINLKKETARESAKNYSITDLKKQIAYLSNLENDLNKIFIKRGEVVIFIENLEKMGKNQDVDVLMKNVSIDVLKDESGNEKHGVLSISMQVNGLWQSVTNFLNLIESMPHHITVESLRLSINSNTSGKSNWGADIMLKVITD